MLIVAGGVGARAMRRRAARQGHRAEAGGGVAPAGVQRAPATPPAAAAAPGPGSRGGGRPGGQTAGPPLEAAPRSSSSRQEEARRGARGEQARREAAAAAVAGVAGRVELRSRLGEVLVDGKSRGISPPLRVLELPPGSHTVEIRIHLSRSRGEGSVKAGEGGQDTAPVPLMRARARPRPDRRLRGLRQVGELVETTKAHVKMIEGLRQFDAGDHEAAAKTLSTALEDGAQRRRPRHHTQASRLHPLQRRPRAAVPRRVPQGACRRSGDEARRGRGRAPGLGADVQVGERRTGVRRHHGARRGAQAVRGRLLRGIGQEPAGGDRPRRARQATRERAQAPRLHPLLVEPRAGMPRRVPQGARGRPGARPRAGRGRAPGLGTDLPLVESGKQGARKAGRLRPMEQPQLGRYIIDSEIGRGAMGVVFKADRLGAATRGRGQDRQHGDGEGPRRQVRGAGSTRRRAPPAPSTTRTSSPSTTPARRATWCTWRWSTSRASSCAACWSKASDGRSPGDLDRRAGRRRPRLRPRARASCTATSSRPTSWWCPTGR